MFLNKKIAKIVLQAGGAGLAFITSMIIANLFNEEQFAEYNIIMSYMLAISSLAGLGFGTYGLKLIPNQSDKFSRKYLGFSFTISLIIGTALTVLMLSLENTLSFPLITGGAIICFAILTQIKFVFQGRGETFISLLIQNWAIPSSAMIGIIITWVTNTAYLSILIESVISISILSILISLLFLKPKLEYSFFIDRLRGIKTPLYFMLTSAIQMSFKFLDIIIMSWLDIDLVLIAVYVAASKINLLSTFILDFILHVYARDFSILLKQKRITQLKTKFRSIQNLLLINSFILGLIFVFVGEGILGLFGDSYKQGYAILLILLIGSCVNNIAGPSGMMLNFYGYHKKVFNITFLSFFTHVSLTFILGSNWGILGVAISSVIAISMRNLLMLYFVRSRIFYAKI